MVLIIAKERLLFDVSLQIIDYLTFQRFLGEVVCFLQRTSVNIKGNICIKSF